MAIDPNIKKKADDIRNKIYGKEVRESLASGLEAMSSDVVENEGRQSVVEGRQDSVESQWQTVSDEMTDKDVISAPEIIAARDGEANLKARLDKEKNEVTAQLAQTKQELEGKKLDKGNVSVHDINKNLGKFDETWMSNEFKQQITGNAPVSAVPAKRSLTHEYFADKSVNADTLDDEILVVDRSINLFDGTFESGGYYSSSSGEWVEWESFNTTNFIPVKPNTVYTKQTEGNQITFWDENHNFVSGIDTEGSQTFTVPDNNNIFYVRFPFGTYDPLFMFVEGDIYPTQYHSYYRRITLNDDIVIKDQNKIKDKIKNFELIPGSVNKFNPEKAEKGCFYEYDTGQKVTHADFTTSDFIPVESNQIWTTPPKSNQITFWDENYNYVEGISKTEQTFVIPENPAIAYMRVPIYTWDTPVTEAMIVLGEEIPTSFIPYSEEKYRLPSNKYIIDVESKELKSESKSYTTPEIKEFGRVTNPVLTKEHVTDRTGVKGVADPFIVFDKGRYHMFFEVLATKDEIGHAYSDNLIDWEYTQIVLSQEEHGHRAAYPNVFKFEGEWYMLPDTVGDIKVYKASNFPFDWEYQFDLIQGRFVDTNIFKIDDIWFMTTSKVPTGGAHDLTLYYNESGTWFNTQWVEHPLGEIIMRDSIERGKRNAGKLFHGGDYIIFPMQVTPVGSGIYGEYTYWVKLSNLTTTTCDVSILGKALEPSHSGDWKGKATHHLSHVEHSNGTIYAVDGLNAGEYSIGLYTNA